MARIGIRSADGSASQVYFGGASDPIHLTVRRLAAGESYTAESSPGDAAVYLWQGSAKANGADLPCGSSAIIEAGGTLNFTAGADGAVLVLYASNSPGKGGGAVHLLPESSIPRYAPPANETGASGGLHANGQCPGCAVWLHENTLPGMAADGALAVAERGVHAHSEDEIIFVTHGAMRLGMKLFGPGTALAIPSGTFYSFTPGPDGVRFINYRNGPPAAFTMKGGGTFDEAGYWKDRVPAPRYLSA